MIDFDKDKVTLLISEYKSSLHLLKEIASIDYDSFIKDPHRIASAKYNLIVAIESAIDICNHLISKNGYRIPEDYADTFKILAEAGLLPKDFAENTLVKMARFRNRLVHLYWKIDNDMLFNIVTGDVKDLEQLLNQFKNIFGINT